MFRPTPLVRRDHVPIAVYLLHALFEMIEAPAAGIRLIPFDHRGGPNGGIEIAYWPTNTFPMGPAYAVLALNESTTKNADARIDAYYKAFLGRLVEIGFAA